MSASVLHVGSVVKLDDVVVTDVLRQMAPQNSASNRDTANQAIASAASLKSAAPTFGFASRQIAKILDKMDGGNPFADIDAWSAAYIQYVAKRAQGGILASGNHRSYSADKGLICVKQISCQYQGDAEAEVMLYPISTTGIAAPFTIADNASLPTIPTTDQRFTLGPVTLGNEALAGVTAITLDLGIQEVHRGADSDIFPTHASVQQYLPTLRIEGLTQEWLSSGVVPVTGLACTQANTTVYLRKRAAGGVYVADGTAEHIKFNMAGLLRVETADNSGNEDAPITLVLEAVWDGTNNLVVWDTTSAIA
jgi:hypothetical protein